VDTPRPSPRTNRTRRVPRQVARLSPRARDVVARAQAQGWASPRGGGAAAGGRSPGRDASGGHGEGRKANGGGSSSGSEGDPSDLYEVRVRLETGRTHQIRAQLAYVGCSIVGDVSSTPVPRADRFERREALELQKVWASLLSRLCCLCAPILQKNNRKDLADRPCTIATTRTAVSQSGAIRRKHAGDALGCGQHVHQGFCLKCCIAAWGQALEQLTRAFFARTRIRIMEESGELALQATMIRRAPLAPARHDLEQV